MAGALRCGLNRGIDRGWECIMTRIPLSIPEIAFVGATRAAFGAGVALLLGEQLDQSQRRAVGWTLLAVGAITTVPIVVQVLKSRHDEQMRHGNGRQQLPESRPA